MGEQGSHVGVRVASPKTAMMFQRLCRFVLFQRLCLFVPLQRLRRFVPLQRLRRFVVLQRPRRFVCKYSGFLGVTLALPLRFACVRVHLFVLRNYCVMH